MHRTADLGVPGMERPFRANRRFSPLWRCAETYRRRFLSATIKFFFGCIVFEEIDVANHTDQVPIVHDRHCSKLI